MSESTVKEQTILDRVSELQELLKLLNLRIDNLVSRDPSPEGKGKLETQRETNVFDEIIHTLTICRRLTSEATEKITLGITQKVISKEN